MLISPFLASALLLALLPLLELPLAFLSFVVSDNVGKYVAGD